VRKAASLLGQAQVIYWIQPQEVQIWDEQETLHCILTQEHSLQLSWSQAAWVSQQNSQEKKQRQEINIQWLQKVQRETLMSLWDSQQETSSRTMYSYSVTEWISNQVLNRVSTDCDTHRVKQQSSHIAILLRTQRHYQRWDSKNEQIRESSENDQYIH